MTYEPRKTDNGYEWDVNAAGGEREIEIEREDYDMSVFVFLTRDDLLAMLAALDEGES